MTNAFTHSKHDKQGKIIQFSGHETFTEFKKKLGDFFNCQAVSVKLGRMKDDETTTFDGKTLLEYTTDRSIWPSKHNAYVVGVNTDNDEDEDDNDDDQELPDDPPEAASGPADDLFPTGDDDFVTFIEQLDEGAGGTVHKAMWMGTTVAVKVCQVGRADERAVAEVKKEAEFLGKLRHPNIVSFFRLIQKGELYFVYPVLLCISSKSNTDFPH